MEATVKSRSETDRFLDMKSLTRAAGTYKVLSHVVRLQIVERLLQEQWSVGKLAEEMNMSQASVSQHLSLLRNTGIVEGKRRGRRIIYSVISPLAHSMLDCLQNDDAQT